MPRKLFQNEKLLSHIHVLWTFQQSVRLTRRMGEEFMVLPHLAQICAGITHE